MFKKILWVTDFSPHAHDAGQKALECTTCKEGKLFVLTVVDPEDLPGVLEGVPDPFIHEEEIDQINKRLDTQYEQQVLDNLKREIESLGAAPASIETFIRVGLPWKEIVQAAKELGVDLIVMGSHGKHNLEELILGSTVENVTKNAHCPVLVVR